MLLEFPSSDKVKVSQLSVNLKVKEVKEKDILWMETNLLRRDKHTCQVSDGFVIGSKILRDKSEGQYLLCVRYGRT